MSKPTFAITVNGQSVTDRFKPRLMSLELQDKRGLAADELTLTLSDHDGLLALPPPKAVITLSLGFDTGANNKLIDKGIFNLTGCEHTSAPDQLVIRALSADITESFKQQKTRSWDEKSLKVIVATIAKNNALTPVINKTLGATIIKHIDQSDESDASFLNRIAEQYDALATVKSGKLLFMPNGKAKTASGKALPVATIHKSKGDGHHYNRDDAQLRYTGVLAYYHDTKKAKRKKVEVGESGHRKHLRGTYPNEAEAKTAAQAAWDKLQRGVESLSLNLATAQPSLIPEQAFKVTGFKQEIDAKNWIAKTVTHKLDDSGYTMSIALELKNN